MWQVFWTIVANILLAASVTAGNEIQEQLDAAIRDYEKAIEAIEGDAKNQLQELFDRFADNGDLEKAQETAALKDRFVTEGILPDVPSLKVIREKAKARYSKANVSLRTAYRKAIAEFTRIRDLRSAEETKRSLQEFESETQPDRLQFPRAAKKRKKDPEPGQAANNMPDAGLQNQPVRDTPPRSRPVPNAKSVKAPHALKPNEDLLAAINNGPERDVLRDRLATSQQKQSALLSLVDRVETEYPVLNWSYADCEYLSSFVISESPRTNSLIWPSIEFRDSMPRCTYGVNQVMVDVWFYTDEGGQITDATPREPTITMARSRWLVAWLLASDSPEEFVQRTQVLLRTNELRSVNYNLTVDEFKGWIASLGCDNREDVTKVVDKLRRAQVPLAAMAKFVTQEGL
jgi:hypothetical protein